MATRVAKVPGRISEVHRSRALSVGASPLFFRRGAEVLGRLGRRGVMDLVVQSCRSVRWMAELLNDPAFGDVVYLGLFRLRLVHVAQDVDVPAVLVALRRPRLNHDRGEERAVVTVFVHPEDDRPRVFVRSGDRVPWWGWCGLAGVPEDGRRPLRLVDDVLEGEHPAHFASLAAAAARPVPAELPPPSWEPPSPAGGLGGSGVPG